MPSMTDRQMDVWGKSRLILPVTGRRPLPVCYNQTPYKDDRGGLGMQYAEMNDEALIDLLFTEEDRLPKAAVDEILGRGLRMVPALSGIAGKSYVWNSDDEDWWAAIHATYILGGIGTLETVLPLLRALRYAAAYECDWVTMELPSIFGKIGLPAYEGLKLLASDITSDWFVRVIAAEGLAAIAITNPEKGPDIFRLIGDILSDTEEDRDVKRCCGFILLDFLRSEWMETLKGFAEEEKERAALGDETAVPDFADDVKEAFSGGVIQSDHYKRDWLEFYADENIRKRQERWGQEDRELMEEEHRDAIFRRALEPFVHEDPRVGRNEPCPCGSGKKYKMCCGMMH